MNTIKIPCSIRHIGARPSKKYTVNALLILNDDETNIFYEEIFLNN